MMQIGLYDRGPVFDPNRGFVPQTGITGAEYALEQGANRSLLPIEMFGREGEAANTQISRATGIYGDEEQQAYLESFGDSPVLKAMLDRTNRNVLSQAAATGDIASGNVLQELSDRGKEDWLTNYYNQMNLLDRQANRGLSASQQASDQLYKTGQAKADYRYDVGKMIAANEANIGSAMSGLIDAQGRGISDIVAENMTNISNMLANAGVTDANATTQLATILANIGTRGSTAQAQLAADAGKAKAAGIAGANQAQQQTLQNLGTVFADWYKTRGSNE